MKDWELPNGVVIEDVPDDVGKHQVAMEAIKRGLAKNSDFGYDEAPSAAPESTLGRVGVGILGGIDNTARKAVNLALPDALTPEFASDERISELTKLNEDLLDTTAGFIGYLGGEILSTAPVGGAVGGTGKALGRSLIAARKAGTVAKAPARVLANTLKSRVGRGAVEGVALGTLVSNPDSRAENAGMSGAFGAGFGALGKIAGKALNRFKLTDISDEAKALQAMTGHFIPLSQSAKPGLVKQFYNALLANIPGVGGKLRGQYKAALDDLRHFAATKAHPELASINIDPKAPIQQIFDQLGKYWKTAYDPMKAQTIGVFKKNAPKLADDLKRLFEKQAQGRYKLLKPGEVTTGEKVLSLRNFFNETMIPQAPNRAIKKELEAYVKSLDDVIASNFTKGSKFRSVFDDYKALREPYRNWVDLQKAAAGATAKEFTPAQLAAKAQRGTQGLMSENQTVLQEAGELGATALENFPSRLGLFQTVAALALTSGGVGAVAGAIPGAAVIPAAIGVGRQLIKPGFQKAISGQSNNLLKYADLLRRGGYSGRQIAAILGEEDAEGQ